MIPWPKSPPPSTGKSKQLKNFNSGQIILHHNKCPVISHVTTIPEQIHDVHREQEQHTPRQQHTTNPHKRVVNAPQKPQKTRRKRIANSP